MPFPLRVTLVLHAAAVVAALFWTMVYGTAFVQWCIMYDQQHKGHAESAFIREKRVPLMVEAIEFSAMWCLRIAGAGACLITPWVGLYLAGILPWKSFSVEKVGGRPVVVACGFGCNVEAKDIEEEIATARKMDV